jgi:hypothetical protein
MKLRFVGFLMGLQIGYVTLTDEHKLIFSEWDVLRGIFGSKREEING